jgi:hypothetical protein
LFKRVNATDFDCGPQWEFNRPVEELYAWQDIAKDLPASAKAWMAKRRQVLGLELSIFWHAPWVKITMELQGSIDPYYLEDLTWQQLRKEIHMMADWIDQHLGAAALPLYEGLPTQALTTFDIRSSCLLGDAS